MSGVSGTTDVTATFLLCIHWLTVWPLMLYVHMMCLWFIYLFHVVCLYGVHYCMILYYMLCTTLCFVAVDTGYCCFIYYMLYSYCCKFMSWLRNAACSCWQLPLFCIYVFMRLAINKSYIPTTTYVDSCTTFLITLSMKLYQQQLVQYKLRQPYELQWCWLSANFDHNCSFLSTCNHHFSD